jgi:hypothetical protein
MMYNDDDGSGHRAEHLFSPARRRRDGLAGNVWE